MTDPAADHRRRLRAARATGQIPLDLLPWLLELAQPGHHESGEDGQSPAERFGVALSQEVDQWMVRRGVTHRTVSCSRRSLARVLKGEPVTTSTLVDIADSLGCDVRISFSPRETPQLAPGRRQLAPASCVRPTQG